MGRIAHYEGPWAIASMIAESGEFPRMDSLSSRHKVEKTKKP